MRSRHVVVIAGPSGSGETTITNEVIRRFSDQVKRLVTATTRPPRAGEKSGIDYYFFTKEEFEREKKKGNIPESTYIQNRDTYYGSYAPDLEKKLKEGHVIIVNPDIVGARFYKKVYDAVTIFIVPESADELERRIRDRSPDLSEKEIILRRENATREMRDERSFYDYVVKNADGKLKGTVDEVVAILKKEGYTLA